jgi:hypothetical protein
VKAVRAVHSQASTAPVRQYAKTREALSRLPMRPGPAPGGGQARGLTLRRTRASWSRNAPRAQEVHPRRRRHRRRLRPQAGCHVPAAACRLLAAAARGCVPARAAKPGRGRTRPGRHRGSNRRVCRLPVAAAHGQRGWRRRDRHAARRLQVRAPKCPPQRRRRRLLGWLQRRSWRCGLRRRGRRRRCCHVDGGLRPRQQRAVAAERALSSGCGWRLHVRRWRCSGREPR